MPHVLGKPFCECATSSTSLSPPTTPPLPSDPLFSTDTGRKSTGSGLRQSWAPVPTQPFTSCVTPAKGPHLSESCFPHL